MLDEKTDCECSAEQMLHVNVYINQKVSNGNMEFANLTPNTDCLTHYVAYYFVMQVLLPF